MTLSARARIALCIWALGWTAAAAAEPLDLAPYKGKVVYLDFWASWCNPCRQSFPWMSDLEKNYGAKGLVVIAVNVDHDRSRADDFLARTPAGFKVVYDPSGTIARQYDFKDMPTSVLIGRDGKIRYVHDGFYPAKQSEYLAHLTQLLNEKGS